VSQIAATEEEKKKWKGRKETVFVTTFQKR